MLDLENKIEYRTWLLNKINIYSDELTIENKRHLKIIRGKK
jgi:hypothetical protein